MRAARTVTALAAATLLLTPGVAAAAPPETVTEVDTGLDCTGTTSTGLRVWVTTGSSARFGDSLFGLVGSDEDPEVLYFGSGAGWSGDSVAFPLEVLTPDREPLGTGAFSATVRTTATTETTSRGGNGNQHVRTTTVAERLAGDATLTLPGYTVGPLECAGSRTTATHVGNRPASTVRSERALFDSARCEGDAVVGLFGPADGEYWLSVDVEHDGVQYNLFGAVDVHRDRFTATLPLRDSQTGESLGDFEVSVVAAPSGPSTRSVLRTSRARVQRTSTPYLVTGSVSLPWGDATGTCEHLEVLTREIVRPGG